MNNHLVVNHMPYVTADEKVAMGQLVYPVTIAGEVITSACQHQLWLVGSQPYRANGEALALATPAHLYVTDDLVASFMLSSKPMPMGVYADQCDKVSQYVAILTNEAQAIDPSVTATPGSSWRLMDQESVFAYPDTATSRAALGELARCFHGQRIGIVGLGGTGSYAP